MLVVVRRILVVLIGRAIEVLQRYRLVGVSLGVVGIWVGHWSVLCVGYGVEPSISAAFSSLSVGAGALAQSCRMQRADKRMWGR